MPVSIAGDSGDVQVVNVDLGDGASVAWGVGGQPQGRGAPTGVEVEVEGEVATYEDVVEDVSVVVSATSVGAKEDLVLASADVPTVYEFPLTLTGVEAVLAGDGVHFINSQGAVVGAIPAGFMEDADGAFSDGVAMDLTTGVDGQVLVVTLDQDWLTEDDRAFPVRVDPTVNLSSSIVDTFVQSSTPTTNYSAYTFMRVGQVSSGGAVTRGLIRFNLNSLMHKDIREAELSLFNIHSASCDPHQVTLYRATEDWDAATIGWPGPAHSTTIASRITASYAGPSCAVPGRMNFDMAKPVRDVVNREWDNYGFVIRAIEDDPAGNKRFATAEATDPNHRPRMTVKWSEPLLGNLGYYTMNTAPLTDRTQLQVNVANRNLLIHGADVGLPGVNGTDLGVNRYYNSRMDIDTGSAGMTGVGWRMDVGQDVRLSIDPYSKNAVFHGPSGYQVTFPYLTGSTGAYDQPAGLNASLVDNDPDSATPDYTITFHDSGLDYHFRGNPPVGNPNTSTPITARLSTIEDTSGNTITMNYNTANRLTSITDTKGRTTTFTYNSNGRVTQVTDPFSRTVKYTYDSNEFLTAVEDATGAITTYTYDASSNLTAITDPQSNVTRFAYHSPARNVRPHLTDITWADSTPTTPVITQYVLDGTSPTQIRLKDPNGNDWLYRFDSQGRLERFDSPRSGTGENYAYDAFNSVIDYTTNAGGTGGVDPVSWTSVKRLGLPL